MGMSKRVEDLMHLREITCKIVQGVFQGKRFSWGGDWRRVGGAGLCIALLFEKFFRNQLTFWFFAEFRE
ncbi:MAG TPA: hypothetical protein DEB17_03780 [Chlorobaculum sp.]|uniref:Uncharacterized protein n=1 Tax=Chlorobaculum tepidum (strain ATCC 49652 / DSM 12025 / NBRC 103806 / TLS) TaxID=194439 RepID=Q8KDW2_CHLTE|nr:hypothetical protein CT0932 [Chlorobaculum tepidum TLS]HBU23105.1 hypothetical protein [Chlorobaculum sp.]